MFDSRPEYPECLLYYDNSLSRLSNHVQRFHQQTVGKIPELTKIHKIFCLVTKECINQLNSYFSFDAT